MKRPFPAVPRPETRIPAVSLRGVSKSFGARRVLDELSLDVQPGELLVVLGPSGAGKSTLLRLVAGLEKPDRGTVSIAGHYVAGPRWVPPEQRSAGMVFQDYALFPHLTVLQNLLLGGHRLDRPARRQRAASLVMRCRLSGLEQRYPHELSGGEQQRVALARALMQQPAILLLDEPFSNLDAALRDQVRAELRALLHDLAVTALFVTHDQEEALYLGHRVAILQDGQITQVGTPEAVYYRPACREVASFLGQGTFLPGRADGRRAHCELGELSLHQPAEGPVELFVRPECVLLESDPDGPAHVVERCFYGHDELVTVRLPSGRTLAARHLGPDRPFAVGARVRFRVSGHVMAYPDGAGRRSGFPPEG